MKILINFVHKFALDSVVKVAYTLLFLLTVVCHYASADELNSELVKMESKFEGITNSLQGKYELELKRHIKSYVSALKKVYQSAQKAGDLETMMEVKQVISNARELVNGIYDTQKPIGSTSKNNTFLKIQTKFKENIKALNKKNGSTFDKVKEDFIKAVNKKKTELTQKGKIKEALELKNYLTDENNFDKIGEFSMINTESLASSNSVAISEDGKQPSTTDREIIYKTLKLADDVELKLIHIKPGSFMRGGVGTSIPLHKVTLTDDFWVGETEVTQKQYETIMQKNPSKEKGDLRPVIGPSWHNAMDFCKKLTEQLIERNKIDSSMEVTLPTAAQWEYMARAGREGKVRGVTGPTQPVKSYPPNPWGIYEILENAGELCRDFAYDFNEVSKINPIGKEFVKNASGQIIKTRVKVMVKGFPGSNPSNCGSTPRKGWHTTRDHGYGSKFSFRVILQNKESKTSEETLKLREKEENSIKEKDEQFKDTEPASIDLQSSGSINLGTFKNGERALTNRGYTLFNIPTQLEGMSFTKGVMNGSKISIKARVSKPGVMYIAMPEWDTNSYLKTLTKRGFTLSDLTCNRQGGKSSSVLFNIYQANVKDRFDLEISSNMLIIFKQTIKFAEVKVKDKDKTLVTDILKNGVSSLMDDAAAKLSHIPKELDGLTFTPQSWNLKKSPTELKISVIKPGVIYMAIGENKRRKNVEERAIKLGFTKTNLLFSRERSGFKFFVWELELKNGSNTGFTLDLKNDVSTMLIFKSVEK
jgi:hypothetical protein